MKVSLQHCYNKVSVWILFLDTISKSLAKNMFFGEIAKSSFNIFYNILKNYVFEKVRTFDRLGMTEGHSFIIAQI